MTTQQANQEPIRKIIRKHLREGEWLICVDRERETYDAVFIRWGDNLILVYPTPYVKEVIGDMLPKAYEVIGGLTPPYRVRATLQYANMLRKQMRRISSTEECHDFVNGLICLIFNVCPEGYGNQRLCDTPWFNEDAMYRRIYDVLSTENKLPNPCDITILPPKPEPPGVSKDDRGSGFPALRKIWFGQNPPEYTLFAHELIHLIPGKHFKSPDTKAEDELYAYHLSPFVVELAKRGIKPPANPVRLYEIGNTSFILEAIREVYNHEFKDIIEFYRAIGAIPVFPKPIGVNDPATLEEYEAECVINDLIEESEHNEKTLQVLLRLLEKLSQKQPRQG
jgi:hypothetical protein